MALLSTRVLLRGHGGERATGTMFFDLLGLRSDGEFKLSPSDTPWRAALITLVEVAIDDCLNTPEPREEFEARITAGLKRAAEWLSAGCEAGLTSWRQGGRKADIFVGGWMEEDQFDFEFPPEFMLACGRLALPMTICTND